MRWLRRARAQRAAATPVRPSPWDRWIDPAIAHAPDGGPRATARLRVELAARRDAAVVEHGPAHVSALLALSDGLVVRAMERAYSRGLPGDARRRAAVLHIPRHRAYEQIRIPAVQHEHALEDAFTLATEIADQWQLPVDPDAWQRVLHDYCLELLTTMRPRSLDDLQARLDLLGAGHAI